MIDVEARLRDLGPWLDVPEGADLSAAVAVRIGTDLREARNERMGARARSGWLIPAAVAAGVALVMALVVVLLPQPRQAVARWFGIGGIRFELTGGDGLPRGLSSDLDLGEPVPADEAVDAVPFAIRLPDGAGPPAAAFAGRPPDGITLVWPPSADLPEVGDTGVGLLLTEFPGTTTETLVLKELDAGTSVEQVSVGGGDGFWITGEPHVVAYLDPDGEPGFDPVRLADNTLLWEVDGVTHRLESSLELDAMLELAESMRPVR
jgi:hypothetical protein